MAAGGAERSGLSAEARRPLCPLCGRGTGVAALPGNHGAGVRLAGGGGGGAQLGEPAVAGLQAGHGTSANSPGRGRSVRTPLELPDSHTACQTARPALPSGPPTARTRVSPSPEPHARAGAAPEVLRANDFRVVHHFALV